MYWPWSLRAARRSGDSLSLGPWPPGSSEPRRTASSAGARPASARAIDANDLRIVRTSLLTDARRDLCKRASTVDVTGQIVLRGPSRSAAPPEGRREHSADVSDRRGTVHGVSPSRGRETDPPLTRRAFTERRDSRKSFSGLV